MSIFEVMTKEMIIALPDEYCTTSMTYAKVEPSLDGDVIVTHPKHSPLRWNKETLEWDKTRLTKPA